MHDQKHVEEPTVVFIQLVEGVSDGVAQRELFQHGLFGFIPRLADNECFEG